MNDAALIIIDVQNDFCPDGALAVSDGDAIIPVINRLQSQFRLRILTQDWHPANHSSFAANHPNADPFSMIEMSYGPQGIFRGRFPSGIGNGCGSCDNTERIPDGN